MPKIWDTAMKQTLLTAFISALIAIAVVALIARIAPALVIHGLGGITRAEFEEFREFAVVEGVPCYIRLSGTDRGGLMTHVPANDDAICMRPIGDAANQIWAFTVLRK
jgi:hypothetical protein